MTPVMDEVMPKIHTIIGSYFSQVIPGHTRRDAGRAGGDLGGSAEGILAVVESIDGLTRPRRDRRRTKGRRGVEWSPKRR